MVRPSASQRPRAEPSAPPLDQGSGCKTVARPLRSGHAQEPGGPSRRKMAAGPCAEAGAVCRGCAPALRAGARAAHAPAWESPAPWPGGRARALGPAPTSFSAQGSAFVRSWSWSWSVGLSDTRRGRCWEPFWGTDWKGLETINSSSSAKLLPTSLFL